MYFQWDIMLLESGFITIIVAPIIYSKKTSTTPKDQISFWLVKWLLFRLMFASGVVKLTSKCPTWWGLSGIHFSTMCFKLQSLNCKLFLNTLFYQPCHFILNHNAFQHHLHGTSTNCPFGFINCQQWRRTSLKLCYHFCFSCLRANCVLLAAMARLD